MFGVLIWPFLMIICCFSFVNTKTRFSQNTLISDIRWYSSVITRSSRSKLYFSESICKCGNPNGLIMLISHLVFYQEQFYFINLDVFVTKKWLNALARDDNMKCYIKKVDPLKVHTHHWLFKLYKFARMCSVITDPYACKHDVTLVSERKRKKTEMTIVTKGGVVD